MKPWWDNNNTQSCHIEQLGMAMPLSEWALTGETIGPSVSKSNNLICMVLSKIWTTFKHSLASG